MRCEDRLMRDAIEDGGVLGTGQGCATIDCTPSITIYIAIYC